MTPPGTYKIVARLGDAFPTFRILNSNGEEVLRFHNKWGFKKTSWNIESPDKSELGSLAHKNFSLKHFETFTLDRPGADEVVSRFSHLHGFDNSTWTITGAVDGPLQVIGRHIDFQFNVVNDAGDVLAAIHRAKVTVRDAFTIDIGNKMQDTLAAIATCVGMAKVHEDHQINEDQFNFGRAGSI